MSHLITESEVEQAALDILSELKYKVIYGPDIVIFVNGLPIAVIDSKV